jgi:alkylation response protein AidB-like acyl-CoA dehydrogenase
VDVTLAEIADLREPIRRLCAAHSATAPATDAPGPACLDRGVWRALGEIGVFSCWVPQERGGLDLGAVVSAALWEELGYGLAQGPLTWSALAAGRLDGVLDDGASVVTGVEPGRSRLVIPDLPDADLLVVLGEDVRIHDVGDLDVCVATSVDPGTSVGWCGQLGPGTVVGGRGEAQTWRLLGAMLSASYLVGLAKLAVDVATEHARTRVQFGRPIGGFQAMKHLIADMVVHAEMARAAVRQAAESLDEGIPAQRSVAGAKALAGEAARIACTGCIQVHGGMGYTWEARPQWIWKRALVWEQSFGDSDAHADALANCLSPQTRGD